MIQVSLKVIPKASVDEVLDWQGEILRVKVRAVPEKGKANSAVCQLLAKTLGLSKNQVRVLRGETTRNKVIEIDQTGPLEIAGKVIS